METSAGRRRTVPSAAAVVVMAMIVLGMLWTGAFPAQAGGPTSVLLANPETGRVAAYGYDDNEYEQLAAAIDAFGEEPESQRAPDVGDDFVHQIRLTWLMHDTGVWRVDLLHHGTDGGWMIETRSSPDGGDVSRGEPVWHRAKDPVALRAVITRAGLLKSAESPASASASASAPAPAAGLPASPVWLGAGALALLGAGLGGGWFLRGRWRLPDRGRTDHEPRVTLVG